MVVHRWLCVGWKTYFPGQFWSLRWGHLPWLDPSPWLRQWGYGRREVWLEVQIPCQILDWGCWECSCLYHWLSSSPHWSWCRDLICHLGLEDGGLCPTKRACTRRLTWKWLHNAKSMAVRTMYYTFIMVMILLSIGSSVISRPIFVITAMAYLSEASFIHASALYIIIELEFIWTITRQWNFNNYYDNILCRSSSSQCRNSKVGKKHQHLSKKNVSASRTILAGVEILSFLH